MKAKTDKPKPRDENEERFYKFSRAIMAVPKIELDKELAKHERTLKGKHKSKSRS